jgi:hypothetical protein
MTPNGLLSVAGLVGLAWLAKLYLRKIEIPGLVVAVVPEDTWFIHRDDNHRLAAVVTLRLTNKSGQEIRLRSARFSGYAPKERALPILLEGKASSHPLPFPTGDQYYNGKDYSIAPFTTSTIWLYYDSGSVDLRNRMSAPLVLRDARGKRTSVRVEMSRHPYQLQLYQQQLA